MIKSSQSRKQRKFLFNMPMHLRNHIMHVHLSKELRKKYNVRALRVIKGDTVKIIKGDKKGTTGKVVKVDLRKMMVYIDSLKVKNARGKEVYKGISPANLIITDLNINKYRADKLNVKSSGA
ncbi:MAG: 50S ribosomal protein L24 [Candidatus Micrarchaeota archaeon]|nr:MAG: 50S ribosomal protein L24 [Candidatus Micrarchaeota archaeon]